jgi:hypothetical protein
LTSKLSNAVSKTGASSQDSSTVKLAITEEMTSAFSSGNNSCTDGWDMNKSARGVKRPLETKDHEYPTPDQYVALDCEFVGVGDRGRNSALGKFHRRINASNTCVDQLGETGRYDHDYHLEYFPFSATSSTVFNSQARAMTSTTLTIFLYLISYRLSGLWSNLPVLS